MKPRDCLDFTEPELSLLDAVVNTNDDSDWWLARRTGYREGTVKSLFRDILRKLRDHGIFVHSRSCALRELERLGILARDDARFVPFGPEEDAERQRERERETGSRQM